MSEEVKNNEFTFENPAYRQTYWHTCSHVMAQAVKRLWPEVKLAIGPSIDEGWYYDLDAPFAFTPEHLEKIEAEMRKICKEKLKLERFELPREEALKFMEEKAEPYKVELINDLPADAHISFYKQGEFTDLCAGPHLDSTGRIKGNALKLTACNAAYWRGDSNRETLQRIYGIAFPKKDELDAYLQRIEEAKKRDHRKLGRELGLPEYLVMRQPFPGPGLAIRVIGEVTKDKLDTLRLADFIFRDEIAKAKLEGTMNQYFAVLTNMRSVGVQGDGRTYDYTLALRSVTTTDFMTADWTRIPYEVLDRVSVRIVNEVPNINRIVYDITSKPPATIEWE